jgi:hypothetical protein
MLCPRAGAFRPLNSEGNIMTKLGILVFLLAAICAAACSSGGSYPAQERGASTGTLNNGVTPDPTVTPNPVATFLGGYLYGELTLNDESSPAIPIQVLMSEDGRFRALQTGPYSYPQTHLLLRGSFELQDRQFEGHGIAIADARQTWSDGESVTTLTISGTLDRPTTSSNGLLLVNVIMASGDSGRIEAKYAVLSPYDYGSDLLRLAGNWVAEQGDDGSWYPDPYGSASPPLPPPASSQIVVAPDGRFSGTDGDGCRTTGTFSLIDTRFSMWSVDYSISECERTGEYSGLLLGDNGWYSVHSLTFTADDGARSQALEFWETAP